MARNDHDVPPAWGWRLLLRHTFPPPVRCAAAWGVSDQKWPWRGACRFLGGRAVHSAGGSSPPCLAARSPGQGPDHPSCSRGGPLSPRLSPRTHLLPVAGAPTALGELTSALGGQGCDLSAFTGEPLLGNGGGSPNPSWMCERE